MSNNYNNLKNMYLAVQGTILYYIAVWTGYTPMEISNEDFNKTVGDISAAEEAQKLIIKGFTIEKKNKKRKMANLGVALAKKVKAFASSTGKDGLFGEMAITFTKLFYLRSNLCLAYAKMILEKANELSPSEKTAYNILAGDLTDFTTSISEFENVISLPREKIAFRKTESKKFKPLFKKATGILTDQIDNLMENFKITHPDFYTDYFNARKIVNIIRHTAIAANVTTPEGADLKKVKVTITGKDKITNETLEVFEEMTDKDGNMIKRELSAELDWDVKFELATYVPYEVKDLDVSPGKHTKLEVVLNKVG